MLESARIQEILNLLAQERPVFHSEADFQHAFAWLLHRILPQFSVRLEVPYAGSRIDLLLRADKNIAFELKYHKARLVGTVQSETYTLTGTAPVDIPRFGFLADIARLEKFVEGDFAAGFALLLTNDRRLWEQPVAKKVKRIDEEFDLFEGRTLAAQQALRWREGTALGGIRGRENGICLRGAYTCQWNNYSVVPGEDNGTFRYILMRVGSDGS